MKELENDPEAIREALAALTEPGQTFEIRCIHERKFKGVQGFFDDIDAAVHYVDQLDRGYQGVYVTLNPVDPELINRAYNRLKPMVEKLGAEDKNVLKRLWLPVDIDPVRMSGTSSTATEHANALKLAKSISETLELVYGFPAPTLSSSGNGAHLLYPIQLYNTDDIRDTVKDFLASLRELFGTPKLDIDRSVFNASRIWRLYGTVARKGDSTMERPHRLSRILANSGRSVLLEPSDLKAFIDKNRAKIDVATYTGSKSLYERAYPKDEGKYRILNRAALDRIDEWVPKLFNFEARPYHSGYRISSLLLNRDLEEDLTIHPWPRGIKDFGQADSGEQEEGRRTPISIVAEQLFANDKEGAADWLAKTLELEVSEFAAVAARAAAADEKEEFEEVFKKDRPVNKKFDYKGIRSVQDLNGKQFRELTFLVDEYLPEGAFFLSSRPKMRKSWLVLQLGIAVATGGTFLDKKVKQGEVLALMLEENDRRLKRRIDTLFTFQKVPDLSNFHYWCPGSVDFEEYFPRGADGCSVIRTWLDDHPDCKLIIIDTWAHFRGQETGRNQNIYQLDYEAVMPLTRLAAERQLTLIIVHHERKGSLKDGNDFIEDTSGSTGLTGGVDGIIAIKGKRGASEENETRQLAITGRDVVHDYLLNIAFDAELGGWRMAAQQDVAETIINLLRKYPVLKTSELYAAAPNIPQARIRQQLLDLRHSGKVENTAHGYRLPGV